MRRRPGTGIALGLACAVAARAATSASLVDFARCLTRAGATFYTAAWCPHCEEQSRMFGNAARWLRTVDCTDGCRGISSFPTWRFADGSQLHGVASLGALAARSGCRLGDGPADDAMRSAGGPGTTARHVGGATIIDVDRR